MKEAYYGLLQTQSALDAANENLKALKEVDRTTDQYVQQKTALPYQSAGIKSQVAQAELQVVTLEDTMQDAERKPERSDRPRDNTSDYTLSGVPSALPEEQDLDLARRTALANRTEIRQAQIQD